MFLPLGLADTLELRRVAEPGVQLEVAGRYTDGLGPADRNLAVRGARTAQRALGLAGGLALRLEKQIPLAAGLGGGSSDAAAAILGVEELAGRRLDPEARAELALEIGADVPFFLDPVPAVGRGVGEEIDPISGVPPLHWLLVALPFEISTGDVYRAVSGELTLPRPPSSIAAPFGPSVLEELRTNDLEPFAVRRHPEIARSKRALQAVGARRVGMSGSGPTVFGQFDSEAEARAAWTALSARSAGSGRSEGRLPEGATAIVTSSPGSR